MKESGQGMGEERVRFTRVYADVPLGARRRSVSQTLPPLLRKLRGIDGGRGTLTERKARQFYLQAKLAEDYTEDSPIPLEARRVTYYPTYETMSDDVLRGYFSWRTQVREGDISEDAPMTYVFVYIYELLHGIGGEADACLARLMFLREALHGVSDRLDVQLPVWIHDFIIYYHMEDKVIEPYFDVSGSHRLSLLLKDPRESSPHEFFEAVAEYATYSVERSVLLRKEPELFEEAVQVAYCEFDAYLRQYGCESIGEMCFGPGGAYPVTLFQSAVFYPYRDIREATFRAGDLTTYKCRDGGWFCESMYSVRDKSELLGEFLREIDRILRTRTKTGRPMKSRMRDPLVAEKLSRILDEFLHEREAAKKPRLVLNMGSLDSIRRDAETTMESLLVDEAEDRGEEGLCGGEAGAAEEKHSEKKEETAEVERSAKKEETAEEERLKKEEETAETASPGEGAQSVALTVEERCLLRILLDGGDWKAYVSCRHMQISMAADSVNEKLMDVIGDTVIEFEGDEPHLIEDYREDVEDLLE